MFNDKSSGEHFYCIQVLIIGGGISGVIRSNIKDFGEFSKWMHEKIAKGETITFCPDDGVSISVTPGPGTALILLTKEQAEIYQRKQKIATI